MTMHNRQPQITRRTVLRGAGAALALPFLESVAVRQARAEGVSVKGTVKPPLRMGIFTVTGGTVLESWKLPEAGPLVKLPSILRSLEFAKDELLLLAGLSHAGKTENLNGHEACAFVHLTGAPLAKKEGGKVSASISVDQLAAQVAGQETFLPSLEFGLSNHETRYSFRAADQPVPYEADPRLVFQRMFRGRKPIVPNWQRRAAEAAKVRHSAPTDSYDRTVVDLVLTQSKDLRKQMSQDDRHKLDEYLYAVQAIEKRISALQDRLQEESLDESNPGPSKLELPELPPQDTNFNKYRSLVHRDPEVHGEYINLVSDLMVLAFQTDTTRICTLAVGDDGAQFPGVVTVGRERHCHTLEHQGNAARVQDADPIAREACRQIHGWYTSLFARMLAKMKQIDEGGSTLLDNSVILYTSYMADGGHGRNDYPVLLAGRAQGTLRPGRQINFQDRTPMSNLYVEMLSRMGLKVDAFGESQTSKYAAYNGRLPDLV
jgi:hypothetical protein